MNSYRPFDPDRRLVVVVVVDVTHLMLSTLLT